MPTQHNMSSDPNYYRRVSDIVEQSREALPPEHRPRLRFDGCRLHRWIGRGLLLLCAIAILAYICDFAVARIRAAGGNAVFGSVRIDNFIAIHEKAAIEYRYTGSNTQTCVHSLFPQLGNAPCWYLSRHKEKRTDY